MMHNVYLAAIDRLLQHLMRTDVPFGGKLILLAGDFRQTCPVIERASRPTIVAASARSSPLWLELPVREFQLSKPQRFGGEHTPWSRWLLALGDGTLPFVDPVTGAQLPDQGVLRMRGGAHFVAVPVPDGVHIFTDQTAFLQWVHPPESLARGELYTVDAANRAVVAAHNATVDVLNALLLQAVPGPVCVATAVETLQNDDQDVAVPNMISEEHMACLHQVGVPEHALKLKVGALAMVTRNLNPDLGLLNGSRVCILHVSPHVVKARTLDAARRIVFIPRLNFDLPLPNSHLRVTRKQFPLRLAYCLTGNKSQGKTLQCVGADLRDDVFSHGQAYVIASRVPAAHQFGVLVHPDRIVRRGDGTDLALMTNVVFPELLRGGAGAAPPVPLPELPVPPVLPADIQLQVADMQAWQAADDAVNDGL
jgi:hypothetical protein